MAASPVQPSPIHSLYRSTNSSSLSLDRLASSTPPSTDSDPGTTLFYIKFKDVQLSLLVPTEEFSGLTFHRESYLETLHQIEDVDILPKSPEVLALSYARFLLESRAASSAIRTLLEVFDTEILAESDLHSALLRVPDSARSRREALRSYYQASADSFHTFKSSESILLNSVKDGSSSLSMVFTGQGSVNPICFEEFRKIEQIYGPLLEDLINAISPMLRRLCGLPETKNFYHGRLIDIIDWLQFPERAPSREFISTAAVSFPIIGLINLAHYCITCKVLHMMPGEVRSLLKGVTGHSQGIVNAFTVAASDSWESFYSMATLAIEILFWIGFYSHQEVAMLSPAVHSEENIDHSSGSPSSMLSVRGLNKTRLSCAIAKCNSQLGDHQQVNIALTNSSTNFVVAGLPKSLIGLSSYLNDFKAGDDLDQSRVPHSKRKHNFVSQFLPISAPFHSPLLAEATTRIKKSLNLNKIRLGELAIPIFDGETGLDMRSQTKSFIESMIEAITERPVDWSLATEMNGVSHILAFGGGGIAELTAVNKEGRGVQVIRASELDNPGRLHSTKADMFSPIPTLATTRAASWAEEFQPHLVPGPDGSPIVDTRMSRVLRAPPIMVAGMTPTTVPWDFVTAIMNSGYHAELAGGGYLNAESMSEAIRKIVINTPPGRGVTANVLYVSPKALAWQIPMLQKLAEQGMPIEGLTVGAGVPSPDVATEYITTLGLKHISFKPGSYSAIQNVIDIAKAHPKFPVILQWTGGRGGGHHSYEDFHAPILSTYGSIRKCKNIVLVAGSGFGDGEGIYPYLTGSWSESHGYAAMPFDGVLLGSRMMVAAEAHTSPASKRLICEAPGAGDSEWERSYNGEVGGVMTVISEMGQPIHKVATRGVRLWAELDKIIFSLPRAKRVAELQKRRNFIVKRLNADYAKPWFAVTAENDNADVEDMSYGQILERLIKLMYIREQNRWIDPSYAKFVSDFALRTSERLPNAKPILSSDYTDPLQFLADFWQAYPLSGHQLVHPEDASFFIKRCKMTGQKPVNFIPALDEDFEYYFKKDSLWQSEDTDAVPDGDAGRVCILQGPVAARFSKDIQPVKAILDGINSYIVRKISSQSTSYKSVPKSEPNLQERRSSKVKGLGISRRSIAGLPSAILTSEPFSKLDTGIPQWTFDDLPSWIKPLFDTTIFRGQSQHSNPLRKLLSPEYQISVYECQPEFRIEVFNDSETGPRRVADITCNKEKTVSVSLHETSFRKQQSTLELQFIPVGGTNVQFQEVMEGRNERIKAFYRSLWLGRADRLKENISSIFIGKEIKLTESMLTNIVTVAGLADPTRQIALGSSIFPMDYAIVIAWDVLVKPLLIDDIDGDLLSLVHLSNKFEQCEDVDPFCVGESVVANSTIESVTNQNAGKCITVKATIERDGQAVAIVTSSFLIKGTFSDYKSTFKRIDNPDIRLDIKSLRDSAILSDKEWIHLDSPGEISRGTSLIFRTNSTMQYKSKQIMSQVHTHGVVFSLAANGKMHKIGKLESRALDCLACPLLDYLNRKGQPLSKSVPLEKSGWAGTNSVDLSIPADNFAYAMVSTDYNPIHVTPIFAEVAKLPGTITHGMFTSMVCRTAMENLVAAGEESRFKKFSVKFTGMVLPRDEITMSFQHTAMRDGRMILEVSATKKGTDEVVLKGSAEVEQPNTAYVFTGQGSQSPGMGMPLYESSSAAKQVWDEADAYLLENYGWSILNIVRNNPKHLTVYFGGKRGKRIRDNYLAMAIDSKQEDGTYITKPILPQLTPQSRSYTFFEPGGLLYSTQFTQPAITILEKATFEHLRSKGLVQEKALFAGHSLGEYGALAAFAEFMPFNNLMDIIFYRGLAMQVAMERREGRTDYTMVAVNPGRVCKGFNEEMLRSITKTIAKESEVLLEIVNYNVEGEQYVCAGHLLALHALTQLLNGLNKNPRALSILGDAMKDADSQSEFQALVSTAVTEAQAVKGPINLQRGAATIPLKGIDVPFHSSHLRPGVHAYRRFLSERIQEEDVQLNKLLGRFIPNVMAKPFSVSRSYLEEAEKLTKSPVLGSHLLSCPA